MLLPASLIEFRQKLSVIYRRQDAQLSWQGEDVVKSCSQFSGGRDFNRRSLSRFCEQSVDCLVDLLLAVVKPQACSRAGVQSDQHLADMEKILVIEDDP